MIRDCWRMREEHDLLVSVLSKALSKALTIFGPSSMEWGEFRLSADDGSDFFDYKLDTGRQDSGFLEQMGLGSFGCFCCFQFFLAKSTGFLRKLLQ